MNHIKSLLGFLTIVLTMMLFTLSAEAQTVTVPSGTDPSVQIMGQIYIEVGNHIKKSRSLDDIELVTTKIASKYEDKIDINVRLNNRDRSYISKCFMYSVEQMLRCTLELQGFDPDSSDVVPYFKQEMTDASKQVEKSLAGANTVNEAIDALENALE